MGSGIPYEGAETDIDDLTTAVESFRRKPFEPGTAAMVEAVEKMVSIYDHLGRIDLADDLKLRDWQIAVLFLMRRIRRLAADRDWDALSRQLLLYPKQP